LEGGGKAEGKTVTRFEFLAVLDGLEAVAAADKSGLPIQVFSDCDSTVAAINCLQKGEPLKKPERYADRADLLPRLQAILAVRQSTSHGTPEAVSTTRIAIAGPADNYVKKLIITPKSCTAWR
jgi:ribonuclease HI